MNPKIVGIIVFFTRVYNNAVDKKKKKKPRVSMQSLVPVPISILEEYAEPTSAMASRRNSGLKRGKIEILNSHHLEPRVLRQPYRANELSRSSQARFGQISRRRSSLTEFNNGSRHRMSSSLRRNSINLNKL